MDLDVDVGQLTLIRWGMRAGAAGRSREDCMRELARLSLYLTDYVRARFAPLAARVREEAEDWPDHRLFAMCTDVAGVFLTFQVHEVEGVLKAYLRDI